MSCIFFVWKLRLNFWILKLIIFLMLFKPNRWNEPDELVWLYIIFSPKWFWNPTSSHPNGNLWEYVGVIQNSGTLTCYRWNTPWKINGWNLQITHLKRNDLPSTSMTMFHVNLQGCTPMIPHFWPGWIFFHTQCFFAEYHFLTTPQLVGGFNLIEKYESKRESSPSRGEHKNIFETTT